ncbi:MAG: glycoside hydrolase family 13 protein [Chloroflexota bacterium]|nr:glycoside hydrolase family 13 protein [Chloroflexota bacterium]
MSTIETPDWVKDAIFYQIFPDRFARSDRVPKPTHLEPWDAPPTVHGFKGGDLLGVAEHLDYLDELGVNAIYFNPIFQSAANHRYHTHDYFQVDPILGGNQAFRQLLDRAHTHGIRVVIDGVFNHSSRGFFQFNHILENHEFSPYLDWFHVFEMPINAYDHTRQPQYAAWWNLHALPKFNTENAAVREFLWDVAEHWVHFGIDGWRLDVPNEIDDDSFWREFRERVKRANPAAYICGEIWGNAQRWLQGDQFDSVMNYLFTKSAIGFFIGDEMVEELIEGVGYYPIESLNAPEMAERIEALLSMYPREVTLVQLNLLSSHDTARFLSVADGDTSALKMATLFQMTYPGAPCIYYGDEIGMMGGKDPDSRAAFPWHDRPEWNIELLDYFKRATALRHAHTALRRGDYRTLHAKGNTYVYERSDEAERLIVAFNAGTETAEFALSMPESRLLSRFGDLATIVVERGEANFNLPPRTGAVWEVEP